eukprot:808905-Prorocentrum_minimum.AAC.1
MPIRLGNRHDIACLYLIGSTIVSMLTWVDRLAASPWFWMKSGPSHVGAEARRARQAAVSAALCHTPVYSHDGPIRRRKRGYILTTDQSDVHRDPRHSRPRV